MLNLKSKTLEFTLTSSFKISASKLKFCFYVLFIEHGVILNIKT